MQVRQSTPSEIFYGMKHSLEVYAGASLHEENTSPHSSDTEDGSIPHVVHQTGEGETDSLIPLENSLVDILKIVDKLCKSSHLHRPRQSSHSYRLRHGGESRRKTALNNMKILEIPLKNTNESSSSSSGDDDMKAKSIPFFSFDRFSESSGSSHTKGYRLYRNDAIHSKGLSNAWESPRCTSPEGDDEHVYVLEVHTVRCELLSSSSSSSENASKQFVHRPILQEMIVFESSKGRIINYMVNTGRGGCDALTLGSRIDCIECLPQTVLDFGEYLVSSNVEKIITFFGDDLTEKKNDGPLREQPPLFTHLCFTERPFDKDRSQVNLLISEPRRDGKLILADMYNLDFGTHDRETLPPVLAKSHFFDLRSDLRDDSARFHGLAVSYSPPSRATLKKQKRKTNTTKSTRKPMVGDTVDVPHPPSKKRPQDETTNRRKSRADRSKILDDDDVPSPKRRRV